MNPIKHKECNAELGVSEEMAADGVRPLPIRADQVNFSRTSFWMLNEHEKAAIAAGAVVTLTVWGSHPPVKLGVYENDPVSHPITPAHHDLLKRLALGHELEGLDHEMLKDIQGFIS